ncbi:SAM-dependent methyltransferase [Sphingobium sp. Sx8-8]|uniref:class I SAM-dependent methyltransferase n=1 Tax=Sphingobium sp. Sx8-8 TaxID=2933617 RepID=UPI001F597685|nr:SAM-dependent methyltransferase [Sphingobium sp. Sx8-8]
MTSSESAAPPWWKCFGIDVGGKDDRHYNDRVLPRRRAASVLTDGRGWNSDEAGPTALGSANGERLDTLRFLLEWMRNPAGTAAVAPSGKALASLITRSVDKWTGPVLELGPGTGVFTQNLIARGVAEWDLTLVEQNPTFARLLKQRFPRATVLGIDAADLTHAQKADSSDFGATICGLGLRSMNAEQIEAIIHAAFSRMTPDAAFYLFTYGRRCSVPVDVLTRLGLVADRVGTTLRNVPPASVYRLASRADAG